MLNFREFTYRSVVIVSYHQANGSSKDEDLNCGIHSLLAIVYHWIKSGILAWSLLFFSIQIGRHEYWGWNRRFSHLLKLSMVTLAVVLVKVESFIVHSTIYNNNANTSNKNNNISRNSTRTKTRVPQAKTITASSGCSSVSVSSLPIVQ